MIKVIVAGFSDVEERLLFVSGETTFPELEAVEVDDEEILVEEEEEVVVRVGELPEMEVLETREADERVVLVVVCVPCWVGEEVVELWEFAVELCEAGRGAFEVVVGLVGGA